MAMNHSDRNLDAMSLKFRQEQGHDVLNCKICLGEIEDYETLSTLQVMRT